jgi:hypothetical protein
LQIVNKGNRQLNKHSKIWAKNAFDALHEFWSFDTEKSIVDLLEDPNFIMVLIDMLVMFVLQVAKKDKKLYPPMKYEKFICIFCFFFPKISYFYFTISKDLFFHIVVFISIYIFLFLASPFIFYIFFLLLM